MRGSIMAGIKWTFTALAVAGAIALVGCNDHSASGADGEATGGETTGGATTRSEEHTSELQSLMRISYAVFCLKKKRKQTRKHNDKEDKRNISIQKHNVSNSNQP